jgi:arginyl-tRNA synthetase
MLIQAKVSEFILQGARNALEAGAMRAIEIPPTAPVTPSRKAEWGDFSSTLALQLAKAADLSPLVLANLIEAHLPKADFVGATSVTPPGFINVTLSSEWLARQVEAILAEGAEFANIDLGKGQIAQVEFVSANPTGPLSVGRGRGAVIGDTMANLLGAAGYTVTREYYFNNAGKQMRDLGESLRVRYLQALGMDIQLTEEQYQGEYLAILGRQLASDRGDTLVNEGWETFKDIAEAAMFESIRLTLARLNIQMDVFFNENSLYETGAVWKVLEQLRERGYIYDKDGAVWFATTRLGGPEDRVVVKSSGEPTYRLPDIAYHKNKLDRGFQLIIDVLGADHKDAFPDVVRGVEALGYNTSGIKMLMNQFVTMKGERMSTRAGRFTTLDELIDEVGADVVRFFMLMRAADTHLEFDLDLALEQSEKNPVFYVQYAHARICSILRKAKEKGFSENGGEVSRLTHPGEQALIRRLLDLSEVINRGVQELAPHHLTTYARDLASTFHIFYRDCQVIDPDAPEMTRARLKLVIATRIGLARTLQLLGVSAPETM